MKPIPSYTKVFALGHRAIADIFDGPVMVQEKIDGSQFSAMLDENDTLHFRTRKSIIYEGEDVQKMFKTVVEHFESVRGTMIPGYVYRGEAVTSCKHNTLEYDRTPRGGIVIWCIEEPASGWVADYNTMWTHADIVGLDVVPLLYEGKVGSIEQLLVFLDTESVLGGTKVEGVVVKNPAKFNLVDHKPAAGKLVSDSFKEKHQKGWKLANPGHRDVIESLATTLAHPNRWKKAVQHAREEGTLLGEPKDIGPLVQAIQADVLDEELPYITEKLLAWALPKIRRGCVRGFPEWYKMELAKQAFPSDGQLGREVPAEPLTAAQAAAELGEINRSAGIDSYHTTNGERVE